MDIHIGKRIEEIAKKKRLTMQEIKDALGTGNRSPTYTYKKKSLPVDTLWRISEKMNHNFFADLHPVTVDETLADREELEKRYRQEKKLELAIRVEFPVSLVKDFSTFLMHANALGLKMGFKVGEAPAK
ncbi:hypothetical protein [Hufsiella ginkgonis]|uniref:Uncharacterized protein n=1 Tax=Hufsiella ginkgonis TaxID=2695274 RepID=A0A7K1XUY8_9SPHI|nr:hypothetical protein [Hufsiella ginkgonis]MXV14821.1 hypothetical protein [Hufsiella ginkgonis]